MTSVCGSFKTLLRGNENEGGGRNKEDGEEPKFEQAISDLREKIRSKKLEAAGVDVSLIKGVKREPEEWQEENLHHSRKRVKVEVKEEVKEEVNDGTISNLQQEKDNKYT